MSRRGDGAITGEMCGEADHKSVNMGTHAGRVSGCVHGMGGNTSCTTVNPLRKEQHNPGKLDQDGKVGLSGSGLQPPDEAEMNWKYLFLVVLSVPVLAQQRPRAADIGLKAGTLPSGPLDAITDVAGVRVGHTTLIRGDSIRTGVTVVMPPGENVFREKVPGAVYIGNAFGKLAGSTQVEELGEIETPIALTSTLNVPRVADALIDYMLALPGNEQVRSINPLVAETNDGYLNDIRGRHVGRPEVFQAIGSARNGPVEEGAVGAGTGTVAFGFKGGIGTASRKAGAYTVGVLAQTNFGGSLRMNGAPVGQELRQGGPNNGDGSCVMVVATDAPVNARNLRRMAARTMFGLARTGSSGANGSGDYGIAFSTARNPAKLLSNDEMSPLFLAVIEATEEAIYNSLLRAVTLTGAGHTVEAIPIDKTIAILRLYKAIQ